MKIAVVGCGALGSFYGAQLLRSGRRVSFLLRSDFSWVSRHGVSVRSPDGDFQVRPDCARMPEEIGPCDCVLIGLKTTANGAFQELLPPLVGPSTRLVTLQNGLGNEEQLAALFGGDRVLGGLCFVCLNRVAPGVIHHLGFGQVTLGQFQSRPTPQTEEIASLFRDSGVDCRLTQHLEQARWEKLVWNIPFNGLGVAGAAGFEAAWNGGPLPASGLGDCLTTDRLILDPFWKQLVLKLMGEVTLLANFLGYPIPLGLRYELIARTARMGAYRPSTLVDFEHRRAIELEHLFLEPLRRARKVGLTLPRLEALCSVLALLASHVGLPAADPGRSADH